MSDAVVSAVIGGVSGFVGVITGAVITLAAEGRRQRRARRDENQRLVLEDLERIQSNAASVLFIFEAIDDFIQTDFDEPDSDYEKVEAIAKLAAINLPSIQPCWKELRKTIYRLFPKTLNNRYFEYFDGFLGDISKLSDAIQDEGGINEMKAFLNERFKNDFIKAQYLLLTFNEELKSIMSGMKASKFAKSREFLKQHKQILRT